VSSRATVGDIPHDGEQEQVDAVLVLVGRAVDE
jgi:hypothetical protein